jgi:hypothetical protein
MDIVEKYNLREEYESLPAIKSKVDEVTTLQKDVAR